jgi:dTMP kinase
MFITFEGGEGAGKSTQIKLLADYLTKLGFNVLITREPGGTVLAEAIRMLLLETGEIRDPMIEFLLLTGARKDHIETMIEPELHNDKVVICDRFFDSTLVYQCMVKGLDRKLVEQINDSVIGYFKPIITFLIDIQPEIGIARLARRAQTLSHYDAKNVQFHNKIRQGFLALAEEEPGRIKVIDGSHTQASVHEEIVSHLQNYLPTE